MSVRPKKFWLLRILIFFAILLVIAAFLLPALNTVRDRHHPSYSCFSNLKQIGLSLKQYAMDYADFFPPEDNAQGLENLRGLDYLMDYGVYVCPASITQRGTKGPITNQICGYIYLGGSKERDEPTIPLAFDKPGNHENYVNVLFLDGHVEGYPTSASNSCEKIILFLNKKYKYSPKLFKKLSDKAKKIDKTLLKKQKG